jgi:hypothetical protein
MSLLLLGPSAWLRGYRPRVPGWVTEVLPPGSPAAETSIPTAKEIRFGLVARLRLANIPVTMLELRPDRAGEDPASKLYRVVRELGIDRYAVYWPFGAVRVAVDVEIGWLLHALQHHGVDGERVALFYEWDPDGHRAAQERPTPDGKIVFESLERQRRTTYYQSLVAWGATPIPWSSYEDLLEFLEVFAR